MGLEWDGSADMLRRVSLKWQEMDLQDFVFLENSAGVVCGKLGVGEWVDGDGGGWEGDVDLSKLLSPSTGGDVESSRRQEAKIRAWTHPRRRFLYVSRIALLCSPIRDRLSLETPAFTTALYHPTPLARWIELMRSDQLCPPVANRLR